MGHDSNPDELQDMLSQIGRLRIQLVERLKTLHEAAASQEKFTLILIGSDLMMRLEVIARLAYLQWAASEITTPAFPIPNPDQEDEFAPRPDASDVPKLVAKLTEQITRWLESELPQTTA